jgi:hypothetical protein
MQRFKAENGNALLLATEPCEKSSAVGIPGRLEKGLALNVAHR